MIDTRGWPEQALCPAHQLDLGLTLHGGQTFSWHSVEEGRYYFNEVEGVPVVLYEAEGVIWYRSPSPVNLAAYFRLDYDLSSLMQDWSQCDPLHFGKLQTYPAIRWLRQPFEETLFAFICSQNNGLGRIHAMVLALREHFGTRLGEFRLTDTHAVVLYSFPQLADLADPMVIDKLCKLKFGYRAAYLQKAAQQLLLSQENIKSEEDLLEIAGVGPKVAACIALFGLGQGHVVPIDVHMWRLATQRYSLVSRNKTLTPTMHRMISEQFQRQFGDLAGWAHLILFASQRTSKRSNK